MLPSKVNFIKPTKTDRVWNSCIFFDTETWNSDGVHLAGQGLRVGQAEDVSLHLGAATYRQFAKGIRERVRFDIPELFWAWADEQVNSRDRFLKVFAHNARFDTAIIRPDLWLAELGWTALPPIDDADGPFILDFEKYSGGCTESCTEGEKSCRPGRCRHKRRKLTIICTYTNYVRVGLAKIGEDLGIPKLPMPADDASEEEWYTYCERDVEVLETFMEKNREMILEHRWGTQKATASGQARSILTRRLGKNWPLAHGREELHDMEMAGYFGGRCEDWWHGSYKELAFQVDVRSMYPSVMRGNKFSLVPTGKLYEGDVPVYGLAVALQHEKLGVVAEVRLNTDIPLYPVRTTEGRVIFPVGRFVTTLTTPELTEAINRAHVEQVYAMQAYKQADIFTDFVNHLWGLRDGFEREGNHARARICKLMLNSGYGKFAQRERSWIAVDKEIPTDRGQSWKEVEVESDGLEVVRTWLTHYKVVDEVLYQREDNGPLHRMAVPIIAAEVTSYARLKLWRLIEQAGLENVLYMDTDSLIVTKEGRDRLDLQPRPGLGELKPESAGVGTHIYGMKDYVTPSGFIKVAGVRRPDLALVAEEGDERVYNFLQFPSYASSQRLGAARMKMVSRVMTGRNAPEGPLLPPQMNYAKMALRPTRETLQ